MHFHETINTPIEKKYFTFCSSSITRASQVVNETKFGNNIGWSSRNLQKISLSHKKLKDLILPFDNFNLKYPEKNSRSKKELVKNKLMFLHNLALNFRKVKSCLKINDRNDSFDKKVRSSLHLTLIPCESSNSNLLNANSCMKSSKASTFNWVNEKILFKYPTFNDSNNKGETPEEEKEIKSKKNQINHEELKQNLQAERSKLTFLNFYPNTNKVNNEKFKYLEKPLLEKKPRRKTDQPFQHYIDLGESKIQNPMNSKIINFKNF